MQQCTHLQNEDQVSLLGSFRRAEYRARGEPVSFIFFPGMNYQRNVDILFRRKLPELVQSDVLHHRDVDTVRTDFSHRAAEVHRGRLPSCVACVICGLFSGESTACIVCKVPTTECTDSHGTDEARNHQV